MENIVEISNLKFKYRNKQIFDDFNLNIKKGEVTAIIGLNGAGKSTLMKLLMGLLRFNGSIKINGNYLKRETVKNIRKEIGVVFENPDNQFVAETVMDDIAFTLENLNYKKSVIKQKIIDTARYIGIEDILEKNPHELSGGQKQLVAFASALVHEPKLLVLDEAIAMIDPGNKNKIYNMIQDLKKQGMSIILVTHDIEETTISDNIVVLDEGKVVLNDKKEEVYKQEKIIKDLGFDLPFMIELSTRLMFYNLLDEYVYDMEKMVDILWK